MLSYEFYKVLHLLGLILTFTGLAGIFMARWNGPELRKPVRSLGTIMHGVGLLFLLVSGFGLAARLGYMGGLPGWVYGKIGIWIFVGALMVLVKKRSDLGWVLYSLIVGAGFLAVLLAVNKPF